MPEPTNQAAASDLLAKEIMRYNCNLFCFPHGYFEEHTAEKLKISEEARQWLIGAQNEAEEKRKEGIRPKEESLEDLYALFGLDEKDVCK